MTRLPSKRSAASAVFRPGCGATRCCLNLSSGCARTTTGLGLAKRKSAFTGSIFIASVLQWRRCLNIWRKSIRKRLKKRARYSCFDHFGDDTQRYGYLAGLGLTKSCEEEALRELVELQQHALDYPRRDGRVAENEYFDAVQNARVVKNAESYYRSMFFDDSSLWNLRDRHMVETLETLEARLERQTGRAKLAVWEHNSHLGDARATEMSRRGEINVGQLERERYGRDAVLVGFTTHHGTVSAASNWGGLVERKYVRPALPGSYEAAFHDTDVARFLLHWHDADDIFDSLREPRLERAIGVIYRPDTERASHYFYARLAEQFDAVLHFDETRAVQPLDAVPEWEAGEAPETFPFAV
jgi:erythromycin esterase-like protein